MIKRFLIGLCCISSILTLMWFIGVKELFSYKPKNESVKNKISSNKSSVAEGNNNLEESAADGLRLALQSLSLSQGAGGFEVWRLNASWANLKTENGLIIAEQPVLKYFFPNKPDILEVKASSGIIDQDNQVLEFIENVVVNYRTTIIKGQQLIYNGQKETMTIPDNGFITSDNMSGSSKGPMTWNIKKNTIEAKDFVSINFGN